MDMKRNPFKEIDNIDIEEHPIDAAAKLHPPIKMLASRIRSATELLQTTLKKSDETALWISLEALLNEYRQTREETFFNLGYQNGFAAGEVHTLRNFKPDLQDSEYQQVAERLRNVVVQSSLPVSSGVAALSEAAWALAFMMAQPHDH